MNQNNVRHRKRLVRRQLNPINDNNHTEDDSLSISDNQQQQQNRGTLLRKKPEGLICSICAGPAHGYNFDAITCESCKAFFRRNALKSDGKYKCRASDGKCVITVTTRKRCKACRLEKCFQKGMRADWILTDEERINKKRKIEENRHLRRMIYPDSADSDESPHNESVENEDRRSSTLRFSTSLSSEDLIKIQQIKQAYTNSVRLTSLPPELPSYPHTAQINAPWELMNLPTNLQASRFITFLKLIPEFSSINENDKLILIKHNTFAVLFIRSALLYDPVTDSYHDRGTADCLFSGKDLIQCFSLDQYEQTTRCITRIIHASQNDRRLIQIMLLIMLFSKGSTVCTFTDESEPIAQDILSLYHTQNIFIDLFWKYCENKFGFSKTICIWSDFVTAAMDAHLQAYNTRYTYVQKNIVADQLVPLMQSVILIV